MSGGPELLGKATRRSAEIGEAEGSRGGYLSLVKSLRRAVCALPGTDKSGEDVQGLERRTVLLSCRQDESGIGSFGILRLPVDWADIKTARAREGGC